MQAIRRNTHRAQQIIANAHNMKRYTLDEYFIGQPVGDEHAGQIVRQYWMRPTCPGKVHQKDSGSYTLHVHSNHWYEFEA